MQLEKMQKRVEEAVLDSYEAMYRIALTYVRDQEDALDIVQESVYKAIRNAGQVKNEQYIPTWICRIVINTAIDFSSCTNLTHDSLMSIINNLTTKTSTTKLTLGATNLAKLSDEEIAIAVNRGWTLN